MHRSAPSLSKNLHTFSCRRKPQNSSPNVRSVENRANSPTSPCGQPWPPRFPLQSGPWQSLRHRIFPAAHSNG
ncbi:hypothetical protein HMPREF9602_00984 [Cutibacterium acnes HL030PA2]|nr:hypothetical protein HMPREF9602_00984 [Cutibacterium acnes HL030PA2]